MNKKNIRNLSLLALGALFGLASCAKDETVTFDTRNYPSVSTSSQDRSVRLELNDVLQKKKYSMNWGKNGDAKLEVFVKNVDEIYNPEPNMDNNYVVSVYAQLTDRKKGWLLWGDYGSADSRSWSSIRTLGVTGNKNKMYSTLRVAIADALESLPSYGRAPGDRDAAGNAVFVPHIKKVNITKRNSSAPAKNKASKEDINSGESVEVRDTVDNILNQMK